MHIFYVPGIKGNTCVMDENESRHSIRVLRMTKGDRLTLVDGIGNLYEGIVSDPDPSGCGVMITSVIRDFEKRGYYLHLAISPIKNQERFEWFIEKSVEIGVDEITPVICRNTEKPGIKRDRVNNIIISAMKQSLKALRPSLNEPVTYGEFINSDPTGIKMIAHCNPAFKREKMDLIYEKNRDAVILIGPEGDFSEEELTIACDNGFKSLHLGTSRLRTETAGIAACYSVYFINQHP
jgi:16S rRNA (uracil1498-N3)-methyltransferase